MQASISLPLKSAKVNLHEGSTELTFIPNNSGDRLSSVTIDELREVISMYDFIQTRQASPIAKKTDF